MLKSKVATQTRKISIFRVSTLLHFDSFETFAKKKKNKIVGDVSWCTSTICRGQFASMHPSILFASNSIKLDKTGQFQNVVDFYFIRHCSQESLSCRAWVTFLLVSIFYFYKIICQLVWISFRISFIHVV